jgi:hypothetical protein
LYNLCDIEARVKALRRPSLRFGASFYLPPREKIANLVNTGSNFRCDKVLAIFPQAERPTSKEFAPKKEICFSFSLHLQLVVVCS